jgi:hypothetical protein
VAVYSTNEANKAELKQSIFLDVYDTEAESAKLKSTLKVKCSFQKLRVGNCNIEICQFCIQI